MNKTSDGILQANSRRPKAPGQTQAYGLANGHCLRMFIAALVAGCLWSGPAFAIPSPDLAVNFFASAAQILGLASMVVGGMLFGRGNSRRSKGGRRNGSGAPLWLIGGLALVAVASVVGNVLQWAGTVDEANRRLEANLDRPSVESGKGVGDVSLKTLSFSKQDSHPGAITTENLDKLLRTAEAGSTEINFIDLREPEERETGYLPGFSHVRYPDFPLVRDQLDLTGKKNVLLCYSGNRSSETCDRLAAQGLSCNFVVGGFEKWLAEGRSVVSGQSTSAGGLRALPSYSNDETLLDTPEVKQLVQEQGAQFVDVRYPGDFERDHLPDAINIPVRKMPSADLETAFSGLTNSPVVAPCYDKRSCFYAKILGARLDRLGIDYRGRYTVPHEYFVPAVPRTHVAAWLENRDKSLLSIASEPLARLLRLIADQTGLLALAILLVVLLLRTLIFPFTAKAERDQAVLREVEDEISRLKAQLSDDKARLSRALMALYRKNGLTPGFNMIGVCLQIPLFLAFFFAVGAAAQDYDQGFFWIAALALPDTAYILPVLVGGIVFLHLHLAATRHTPARIMARFGAGVLLTVITLPLAAAVNLYLVLSIAMMLLQTQAVRLFIGRRRAATSGDRKDAGARLATAGNGRVFPLSEAGWIEASGGKAGRLGQILAAGLPVPDGLVIVGAALPRDEGQEILAPDDWRVVDAIWPRLKAERVAVRSSGLNEDGDGQSYAGVFESLLNISRDNLEGAIGAVNKSFRTASAAAYGGNKDEHGAVLIQKMVDAKFAGVMFTEHPGESGSMLIEMVAGLGAAIADGTATPDVYRVGRYTGRLLDDSAPPVDLDPLVGMGRILETLFGSPQDIEWAHDGERFLILQSRNITALSRNLPAERKESVLERERHRLLALCDGAGPDEPVFVQNELSELLPRPTPFSLSFMEALWQPGGSTDLACRALRIPYDVAEDSPAFVTSVFGALYVNHREEKRRLRLGTGAMTSFRLTRMAEKLEQEFRNEFLPEFHHEIRVYEAVDTALLKTDELFTLLDHVCTRFITINYVQAHIVNIAANFYVTLAERQLRKNGLSPAVYLGQMPSTVVTRAMSMLPEIRAGREPVENFLDLFGHRSPIDYEFADPRYMEDPALVEQLVRAAREMDGVARPSREPDILPDDRTLALCLERAGLFQELKEEAKHHCLRELAVIRRVLIALDERLELDGGIFFVPFDDVQKLRDTAFLAEARSDMARRKVEHEIFETADGLPAELTPASLERLNLNGGTAFADTSDESVFKGNLVAGEAPVQGLARVVKAGDLDVLLDGEILITRFIHPQWAPAFPRLTGVVTEVGGWLSHAAILAREYNVPTVVGARGVMGAIATGDNIQLNPDGSIERV